MLKIQEKIDSLKTENVQTEDGKIKMLLTDLKGEYAAAIAGIQNVQDTDKKVKRAFAIEKRRLGEELSVLRVEVRKLDDTLVDVKQTIVTLVPEMKVKLENASMDFVNTLNSSHTKSVSMFSKYLDSSLHSTQSQLTNISTTFVKLGNHFNASLGKVEQNMKTGIDYSLNKALEERFSLLKSSITSGLTSIVDSKMNFLKDSINERNANVLDSKINSLQSSMDSRLTTIQGKLTSVENTGISTHSLTKDIYWTNANIGYHYPDYNKNDLARLANITKGREWVRGRLEVFHGGTWGTVCDDSFDESDAKVACKMFSSSTVLHAMRYTGAWSGSGKGPILLDEVGCSGSESSLFDCSHSGVGTHNCGHSEDVTIYCRWSTSGWL